jgi:hypothetical protein
VRERKQRGLIPGKPLVLEGGNHGQS